MLQDHRGKRVFPVAAAMGRRCSCMTTKHRCLEWGAGNRLLSYKCYSDRNGSQLVVVRAHNHLKLNEIFICAVGILHYTYVVVKYHRNITSCKSLHHPPPMAEVLGGIVRNS